jgi:hypothetical protein
VEDTNQLIYRWFGLETRSEGQRARSDDKKCTILHSNKFSFLLLYNLSTNLQKNI